MNEETCTCGCKYTLAQCRIYDSACHISKERTAKIVAESGLRRSSSRQPEENTGPDTSFPPAIARPQSMALAAKIIFVVALLICLQRMDFSPNRADCRNYFWVERAPSVPGTEPQHRQNAAAGFRGGAGLWDEPARSGQSGAQRIRLHVTGDFLRRWLRGWCWGKCCESAEMLRT